jgi:hypothetical protein
MEASDFQHGVRAFDTLPHHLEHTAGQLEYLASLGDMEDYVDYEDFADTIRTMLPTIEEARIKASKADTNPHGFVTLAPKFWEDTGHWHGRFSQSLDDEGWLTPSFLPLAKDQRVLRVPDAAEMAKHKENVRRGKPVVVDNLITPEALEMALEACYRTNMWLDPKPWGYLGAYPTTGLLSSHPVFVAIGRELREVSTLLFLWWLLLRLLSLLLLWLLLVCVPREPSLSLLCTGVFGHFRDDCPRCDAE